MPYKMLFLQFLMLFQIFFIIKTVLAAYGDGGIIDSKTISAKKY